MDFAKGRAVALVHFMPPATHPEIPLARYRERLPRGSLLALSHATTDDSDAAAQAAAAKVVAAYEQHTTSTVLPRTREEIAAFFGDFELVEPGLVWLPVWRPDEPARTPPARSDGLAGAARKR
jgi:hypothetical protein